jgi:aminoglycoside 3-N-acetyltransferase
MNFKDYLKNLGLSKNQHLIIHSSFKKIFAEFNPISPQQVIDELKSTITKNGSIIFPTFTYCFKKSIDNYEVFDKANSKSKVGLLSETFRLSKDVIRTSSPTHSFALWGKITEEIDEANSPESPLGKGSVLDWLTQNPDSLVLMLGTDFSSLSYGHYLEVISKVPWYDYSPWDYMNVLPIGVSVEGEQKLKEIPGCAKGFVNFEKYLIKKNLIRQHDYGQLSSYFISIELLYREGLNYFKENYKELLCPAGFCPACDSRRRKFL